MRRPKVNERQAQLVEAQLVECPVCGGLPRTYNPNLNPNLFTASAPLPCRHCDNTGQVDNPQLVEEAHDG